MSEQTNFDVNVITSCILTEFAVLLRRPLADFELTKLWGTEYATNETQLFILIRRFCGLLSWM
jgi:hypothetical protein